MLFWKPIIMTDRDTTPPEPPSMLLDPNDLMDPALSRLISGVADAVGNRVEDGVGRRLDGVGQRLDGMSGQFAAFITEMRTAYRHHAERHDELASAHEKLENEVRELKKRVERLEAAKPST